MSTSKQCPRCGNAGGENTPGGLCAACLLQPAMQPSAAGQTTPFEHHFTAPAIAEIASLFPELEILQLLGQGGMGAVYQARQTRLDRMVALKILPKMAGQETEFANRFSREARAMARLNHPNIVNIHDYGDKAGWCFFIMEYVDGVNLRQAIKTKSVEPPEALSIVGQICDALQYAHQEGIVHRDIKPENILLDKRGRVKIADFGLAKLLGQSSISHHLTATNQVMGTVGYMAPEQMEGSRQVDHRADLYAVGVVFYELLTGELPLGRFAPPSQKVRIDLRIDEVVLKTLEKEPDRRYQYASQIKQDVESISRGTMAARPLSPAGFDWVQSLPWLKNPVAAGIALLVLGSLEFGLFLLGMFQMSESRLSYSETNKTWLLFTMTDLFFGAGVALAGLLFLWRRFWILAVLGAIIAVVPLAQLASLLKANQNETSLEQLIALAEKQGIKWNTSRNEVNSYSFEASQLRDKILNLAGDSSSKTNQLIYVRWPTIFVIWLSIPAGIWALILLFQPSVKGGFRRWFDFSSSARAPVSSAPSQPATVIHAARQHQDATWYIGFAGLFTVVALGLGSAFCSWIACAILSGQSIRMPFHNRDAGELTFLYAFMGIGLVWLGLALFIRLLRQISELGMNAANRAQFIFLALFFSIAGLLLLGVTVLAQIRQLSLSYYFDLVIVNGSEALGWITGLLSGGIAALIFAIAPIERQQCVRLLKWGGLVLLLLLAALLLLVPTATVAD